jgi:hypothetical protein
MGLPARPQLSLRLARLLGELWDLRWLWRAWARPPGYATARERVVTRVARSWWTLATRTRCCSGPGPPPARSVPSRRGCGSSPPSTPGGLHVAGASVGFPAVPAMLAETVLVPVEPGLEVIADHLVYGTARLDVAAGARCRWQALSLPDSVPPPAWLVLGAPGRIPAPVVACVRAAIGQVTLALRQTEVRPEPPPPALGFHEDPVDAHAPAANLP